MNKTGIRIILDKDASSSLEQIIEQLKQKEKYLKISSSRLSSWIIKRFYHKYFPECLDEIVNDHFNKKEFLKSLLSQANSNQDIDDVVKKALSSFSMSGITKKRGRKSKKALDIQIKNDDASN